MSCTCGLTPHHCEDHPDSIIVNIEPETVKGTP